MRGLLRDAINAVNAKRKMLTGPDAALGRDTGLECGRKCVAVRAQRALLCRTICGLRIGLIGGRATYE